MKILRNLKVDPRKIKTILIKKPVVQKKKRGKKSRTSINDGAFLARFPAYRPNMQLGRATSSSSFNFVVTLIDKTTLGIEIENPPPSSTEFHFVANLIQGVISFPIPLSNSYSFDQNLKRHQIEIPKELKNLIAVGQSLFFQVAKV